MSNPLGARSSTPTFLPEDEGTPAHGLRAFRISDDTKRIIAINEQGKATLDVLVRFAVSVNASQQKIWHNVGSIEGKVDQVLAQSADMAAANVRMETHIADMRAEQKKSLADQAESDRLRREGDAHLSGLLGAVMGNLSENGQMDAATRQHLSELRVVTSNALTKAENALATKALPLSAHGRRQVTAASLFGSFVTLVGFFKDPILAVMKAKGWIQ